MDKLNILYICNPRNVKSKNAKWNNIIKKFDDITMRNTDDETPYCIISDNTIYFNFETYINPSNDDLFDLLHEIGHIKTGSYKERCLEEFYATQWAIDNCKKYNVILTKEIIDRFQKYIFDCKTEDKSKNIKRKDITLIVEPVF